MQKIFEPPSEMFVALDQKSMCNAKIEPVSLQLGSLKLKPVLPEQRNVKRVDYAQFFDVNMIKRVSDNV